MKNLLIVILAILLLAGCSQQQQHMTRHEVILIDVSASINPDSLTECLESVHEHIKKMDRGDYVSLVPISGDADVESSGKVLRFQKPLDRTAYDADLIAFSKQAQQALQDLRTRAVASPSRATDIFGAIRMAEDEFAAQPKNPDVRLIIFSDFIQDDGVVDFKKDHRLRSKEAAIQYAIDEGKSWPQERPVRKVYLGLLRSKDLQRLDKPRREAIRQFWLEYFKTRGSEPHYMIDGVGLLSSRLEY